MSKTDTNEFISNPSKASESLVNNVVELNKKYEKLFTSKNIFIQLNREMKIVLYLKADYLKVIEQLSKYKVPATKSKNFRRNVKELLTEFEFIYDKLIYNNFILAKEYLKFKDFGVKVQTKEDERMNFLKKFAKKQISKKEFDNKFGHYGINAYELSEKRFNEYTEIELRKIASLSVNLKEIEKIHSQEFISSNEENRIPILIYIRELAKYKALLIVAEIRVKLIENAKENNIKDVFNQEL